MNFCMRWFWCVRSWMAMNSFGVIFFLIFPFLFLKCQLALVQQLFEIDILMISSSYHLGQPSPKVRSIQIIMIRIIVFLFRKIELHVKLPCFIIILLIVDFWQSMTIQTPSLLTLRSLFILVLIPRVVTLWLGHRHALNQPLCIYSP